VIMNSTSKISKFEQCVRPLLRQNLWVSPSTPSLSPPPVVTTWPTRGFSVHSPKRGKDGPCQPKWRRHGDQDKNQTTPRLFSWIRRAYDPWFPLDYGQGQDYRSCEEIYLFLTCFNTLCKSLPLLHIWYDSFNFPIDERSNTVVTLDIFTKETSISSRMGRRNFLFLLYKNLMLAYAYLFSLI
jgi:hypothetical protein